MNVLFARHGESLANREHIISNRDLPHPLTERGRQQADQLAESLAGRELAAIYTSPVPRARETAGIIAAARQAAVIVHDGLREYDCGELEGRADAAAWQSHQDFLNAWLAGQRREAAPPGGETFEGIRRRFAAFLAEVGARHAGERADVLCVSHGGLLILALPGLLENVDFTFARQRRPGHAELIVAAPGASGWTCLRWGETILEESAA